MAPTVTASGAYGKAIINIQTLIANSSVFRTWVGAADASTARESIYIPYIFEPAANDFPFVAIDEGDHEIDMASAGVSANYLAIGAAQIYFVAKISATFQDNTKSDVQDAYVTFRNAIDGIIQDMATNSGLDAYIQLDSIRKVDATARSIGQREESGHYYQVQYEVTFGSGGSPLA